MKCDGTRAETRFRLSAKRTSPFKSAGASVHSTAGSGGVRISGSNAGYTVFRGSVKSTGYQLDSPVSPSLPLSCVTVCHHISAGAYLLLGADNFVSDVKCKKQLFKRVSVLKHFSHFQVPCIPLSSHAQSLLKEDQFCVILFTMYTRLLE